MSAEMITTEILDRVCDADLQSICEIESVSFGDEAWSLDGLRDFLDGSLVFTSVLRLRGSIVSFACAICVADEAELTKVATLPAARGRGYAKAVIDNLIKCAAERGIRRLLLEVRESNAPARALYDSFGFAEYSRQSRYYASPREDAVLMEKLL